MASHSFDKKSLFKNGKRWFPIMGEIHYSRVPAADWKDSLLKMKEGGVDIVSSYTIWIHHEEIEGEFDFSGCRNLRRFVETVKECDLEMILRIGPWSHAEVRHGGFPDWLLTKCPDARDTNDDKYFSEVEKFYCAIFSQVEGLLLKDGGPIIGVQIENEYGHCGGLKGEEGEKHIRRLTKMAKDVGFDVPFYTATGWGGAITAGLLPVMGGYCEAPWDPRTTEIEPSGNYVFTHERNDHAIGCDFGLGEGISFDMNKFPYLTAELGGGLQPTQKRRPISHPEDIGAMSLAKLGSGCNLLGYYMYHGGQNPEGKLSTLEENIATGSLNNYPCKNYDFRSPLGEYGNPNGTYNEIKLFSLFVHDFGEVLSSTDTIIPKDNPLSPENSSDLRTSWRVLKCEKSGIIQGFVFVNNYQRRQKQTTHKGVSLSFKSEERDDIVFPSVDILDRDFFFLPFNMPIGSGLLKTSLTTPLCILKNKKEAFVFYSATTPTDSSRIETSFISEAKDAPSSLYQFKGDVGESFIVTLSLKDALRSHKVSIKGKEYLILTDSILFVENIGEKTLLHFNVNISLSFFSFPSLESVPSGFKKIDCDTGFTEYVYQGFLASSSEVSLDLKSENEGTACYEIKTSSFPDGADDVFIDISFVGNGARLFENGTLIDDTFFLGEKYPWSIGLKRYGEGAHTFTLEVDRLNKEDKVFIEEWPDFCGKDSVCEVKGISSRTFSKVTLSL